MDQTYADDQAPEGFDLSAEAGRQAEAASSGITERTVAMDEIDADAAQVAAEHDDDATDDLGRTPIPEDV